jgi:hypothetical protein
VQYVGQKDKKKNILDGYSEAQMGLYGITSSEEKSHASFLFLEVISEVQRFLKTIIKIYTYT